MCGIISVLNCFDDRDISKKLIDALERLEYRGYDSSGIAIIKNDNNNFMRIRSVGRIKSLREKVDMIDDNELLGHIGIGHTRWATHGGVEERNAHPHISKNIAIVHNGIVENYENIREFLISQGYEFESMTDSEVIAGLISYYHTQKKLSLEDAFLKCLDDIHGTYAIVCMSLDNPDLLMGAKKGSPMAIGILDDNQSIYIASDAIALSNLSKKIIYLEENDRIICERKNNQISYKILDRNNNIVVRQILDNTISMNDVTKNGFEDYMLKEIYEEPQVMLETYNKFQSIVDIKKYDRLCFIACGTSYYAGLLSKYWIEDISNIPVDVEIASEFRYRNPVMNENTLYIVISQSGETIDTLCAMRNVLERGFDTLSFVNVDKSSIARESKYTILTHAGVEMGVASTKAFISQILSILLLIFDKKELNIDEIIKSMIHVIDRQDEIKEIANQLKSMRAILYIGRGTNYPISLEGSLKMKEISYINSEAYPSGEIKHGPIALVDENVCTVVLCPNDRYFEKTISNAQEILARKGKILLVLSEDAKDKISIFKNNDNVILFFIKKLECEDFYPFVLTSFIHVLAYYTAKIKGLDVDKPRNLAKSVTVE